MSVVERARVAWRPIERAHAAVPDAWVMLGLALFAAALFVVRATGLPNLLDNEYRVGASALDVLQHGDWLCPHDLLGNTDKPPLLVWLVALASWPSGHVTPLTLYLPTAIATVLTAWLVVSAGTRRFGGLAGALGGFAYLCSHIGVQQMGTARWDGLFAFTVTLTALAAFRAWMTGRGWTLFWLAATAATLTKGPLGVLLAAMGLLAVPWERRSGRPRPLAGSQATGVTLFAVLTLGWFALAYLRVGPHLVDDMIRGELLGHVVEHRVGFRFWKPLGDVAANFAPWIVFGLVALYRVVRTPAVDDETRAFERFLFCWFIGGLVLFSLSPHNQSRLMDPMIPPLALLAGRELDRGARWLSGRALATAVALAAVAGLVVFGVEYHHTERRKPGVRETIALTGLATNVRRAVGTAFPLTFTTDTPPALQLALDTMRPPVAIDDAAALLRSDAAAFVVVSELDRLRRALGAEAARLHVLYRAQGDGTPPLYVVGNRPTLAWDDPTAARVGPLVVRLSGAVLGPAWTDSLELQARSDGGVAEIDNASSAPQHVDVRRGARRDARTLAPGEVWRVEVPCPEGRSCRPT